MKKGLRKVLSLSCAISLLLTCLPFHAVSDGEPGFEQEDILLPELTETADPVPAEEEELPPAEEPDGEPEEAAAPEASADETDKETTQETVPGAQAETDPAAPAEPAHETPAEPTPDTPAAEPAEEPEPAAEEAESAGEVPGESGEEGPQEPGNEEPPAQEPGDEEPAAQETEPDDPDRIPADRVIDLSGDPEQNDLETAGTLAKGKTFVIRILSGAETDLFFVLEGSAELDAELTDEEYGQKKTFVKVNEDADAEGSEETEDVPERTRSVLTGIHFEQDSSRLVHINGDAGTTFSLRVLTPAGWAALQAAGNEPVEGDETEPAGGEGTAAEGESGGEPQQDDPAQGGPDPEDPAAEEPAEEETAEEEPVPEELPAFEITEDILVRYNGGDETVSVPDGIREIGSRAFCGNESIRKVVFPDSVEIINNSAFADCMNLETVEISEQSALATIGHMAFRNDAKLDLSFAANVPNMMETAFEGAGISAGEEESGEEGEETGEENGEDPEAGEEENEEDGEKDEEEEEGEEPDGDAEDGEEEEPLPQESPLVFEGEDYTVTVAFGEDAGFLQGTELNVREILPGTEEYRLYSGQTEEVLNENWDAVAEFARYFDITFIYNEEEIEPLAPIDVQVTFAEAIPVAEDSSLQAIHFAEEGAQVIDSNTDSVEAAAEDYSTVDTVAFSADSFSVYAFVQTAKITEQVIAADGNAYRIEVTYEQDSGIPLNAGLSAAEILPEDGRYEELLQEALAAAGRESAAYARFFDIEIQANEEKIEPQDNVSVRMTLDDVLETEPEELKIVHFAEEETVVLDAETGDDSGILFETDSFSVYGVLVTEPTPVMANNLDGRTFKIAHNSQYFTADIVTGNTNQFRKTANPDEATVWQFESAGEDGKYYIYTYTDGVKQYMRLNRRDVNNAHAELGSEPQAFTVNDIGNGNFTLSAVSRGTTYYLNEFYSGSGFAGWHERSASYDRMNLIEYPTSVNNGEEYILVVKHEGEYYTVLNDGTLRRAEALSSSPGFISTDDPMVWQYDRETLHHNGKEAGFNGSNTTSDFFYRYIDPDSPAGYLDENYDNTIGDTNGYATEYYISKHLVDLDKMKITYSDHHISSQANPGNYIGVEYGPEGLRIAGKQTQDNAAEIYFMKMTELSDIVDSERDKNHVVNHIDISVKSNAAIRIPLAYGKYYYKDETGTIQTLMVNRENPVTVTVQQQIDVNRDDIKRANIETYTIDSNGTHVPKDNTYFITGYSGNTENDTSADQVRIEGIFKVADLDPVDNVTDEVRQRRLNHKIYYTVTTTKDVKVPFIYNGFPLYESEKAAQENDPKQCKSGTAIIRLSSSFNYWDPANECPPVSWSRPDWMSGGIPGGSGMDFALGGMDEDQNSIRAVEITKYFLDEAGNPIVPKENVDTLFHIYRSSSASYEDVIGMDVDTYAEGQANYNYDNNYFPVHDKTVTVGDNGIGIMYDYDVPAGMIYITEDTDEKNLPRSLTDINGLTWKYKKTYFETEYVWRDDGIEYRRHVSKEYTLKDGTYRSIPEILGKYEDINGIDQYNGFLEFYVYNVYSQEPIDVSVKKNWMHENGTVAEAPDHARVTVTLGRYKLIEDPDHPITGNLVINHSVTFKPGETAQGSHYNVSYALKQGNRVVRSGSFSPAGTSSNSLTMTDLPDGTYTLMLDEGVNGYTAETSIDGTPATSKTVTITAGRTTSVGITTELTPVPPLRLVPIRVTNALETNNPPYQDDTYYFPAGRTIVFTIYRPGKAFQNSGFWARVNGADFPWPDGDPNSWIYVDQKWEYTIPANSNGETLAFIHNWGNENFVIKSVVLKSESGGSRSLESNSASGTDGTKRRLSAAKGPTRAATVLTGNPPVSDLPGMIYVEDTDWPTAEEGDINRVVLGGGLWEDVVMDLAPADSQGHKYLYYIAGVEEQNVPEGTRVEILSDKKGYVLTSNGETVLQVTNTVPDEPPKITLQKTDENGVPLTGASFDFTKPDGTTEHITINAPNGIYQTEELDEGAYVISEVSAPDGYVRYSGVIAFTVQGNNVIAADTLPNGVTYDAEGLTFKIKNQPESNRKLRIIKRWLDIFGNAAEAPAEPVRMKLIQMVRRQMPSRIVRVEFYYHGDGSGTPLPSNYNNNNVWTQVDAAKVSKGRGTATVEFRWNRWTEELTDSAIRIEGPGSVETLNSPWFRIIIPDNGESITTVKVYVENNNWSPWGTGTEVNNQGQIRDIQWPNSNDPAEGYIATGGTKTVTLNSGMQWVTELEIRGNDNNPLTNSHAVLPATYEGRECRYMVLEEPVPEGYSVSYSDNNLEGLGQGSEETITAYNRENTTDITVVKVDKEDHQEKLPGAVFEIRKLDSNAPGVNYLDGWTARRITTGSEGQATVPKLDPGYYEVREITPPAGYVLPEEGKDRFYFRVSSEGVTSVVKDDAKYPARWAVRRNDSMLVNNKDGSFTFGNEAGQMDIHVLKVDTADMTTPLTGAKFVLKQYDVGYKTLVKTWEEQETSEEAGSEGTLSFEGLQTGYYELVETQAPVGYIPVSAGPIRFRVEANGERSHVEFAYPTNQVIWDEDTRTFKVGNKIGVKLPNTGGPGTALYTIPGLIMILLAGGTLARRKRRATGKGRGLS